MLTRVLIALDGSPESEQVIPDVERLAGPDTSFDLLHVIDRPNHEVPGLGLMVDDVAESYLKTVASRLGDRKLRLIVRTGDAAEQIAKAARELRSSLIALTTHGRKGLSHLLMGSVAEAVIRTSSVPVLVSRLGLPAKQNHKVERILVPIDGTLESRQICETVRDLVENDDVEVVLLQVVIPPMVMDAATGFTPIGIPDPLPDLSSPLQEFAHQLEREGLKVRVVTEIGSPAMLIPDKARELDVDLIAMATAGRKGFFRFVMGSVAEDVLRHADRPVLLHRIGHGEKRKAHVRHAHSKGK